MGMDVSSSVITDCALASGGSFTGATVMVSVAGVLALEPPLAVPPLSNNCAVTVAVPLALGADANVRVPLAAIAGGDENSAFLWLLTIVLTVWPDSLAVPSLIAGAEPRMVC